MTQMRTEPDTDHGEARTMSRRMTDASKIMLPLPLTITLVVGVLAGAGGMWTVAAQVSNINTRLEAGDKLRVADSKLQDERMTNLRDTVNRMTARQELQQYEVQQLKDIVNRLNTLLDERKRQTP
jgi:TolA-binding protein